MKLDIVGCGVPDVGCEYQKRSTLFRHAQTRNMKPNSWKKSYTLVLVLNAVYIVLFYLLMITLT